MESKDIIKKAQAECGEYVTGYRMDITIESLNAICEAMWTRAINLTYCFTEWLGEVLDVIGKKNFESKKSETSRTRRCKPANTTCFTANDTVHNNQPPVKAMPESGTAGI